MNAEELKALGFEEVDVNSIEVDDEVLEKMKNAEDNNRMDKDVLAGITDILKGK